MRIAILLAMIWLEGKGQSVVSTLESWRKDIDFVVEFMRELSLQTDPQIAANLYGRRIREGGFFRSDGFMAVSRRDLDKPYYRITRSSLWKEQIDPWKEKDRLPLFDRGLLSELVYANEATVISDLPSRYAADDPAAEYFQGMQFLLAIPQFDNGEALNMTVMMTRDSEGVERDKIATMILQTNIWGRSVLSSVLRRELAAAYDALDHELKAVGRIQRSLLPTTLPDIPGLDLAAHYETSQRAGGDYYDFFPLSGERWGFIIADVSGHGIPAAVRMAITHAIAHTRPNSAVAPSEMLFYLNSVLENRYIGRTGSFVTAMYAQFDPSTRELVYSSAGHPAPRLVHNERVACLENLAGLPLGIDPVVHYPQHRRILSSGDRLLFYTDGVSEAFNAAREQFGTDAMDSALLAGDGDAAAILTHVLADLKRHSGDIAIADDRTLVAMCVE